MANDLNQCTFTGRLGADPDVKYIPSGDAVANFTVAVGSQWKDKDTGEKKESAQWVRCVAWRKTAELVGTYLSKGKRVLVQGKWQTRTWDDKDGKKQYMTEIVADNIIFLDPKDDSQGYHKPQEPPGGVDPEGDIPF